MPTISAPFDRHVFRLLFWQAIFSLVFTTLGSVFIIVAYGSLLPFMLGILHLTLIFIVLVLLGVTGREYWRLAFLVFSSGWMAMGIGGIFLKEFNDFGQLFSDAAGFYKLSSDEGVTRDLSELSRLSEGALAIRIWQWKYDIFAAIGFPRAHYVGILANVSAMTVAAVLGGKMIQIIFGNDDARLRRYSLLFATSGLFWIFAGLHVRDAFAALTITFLCYIWILYIVKSRSVRRLFFVVAGTLLFAPILRFLREEFSIFPFLFLLALLSSFRWRDLSRSTRYAFPLIFVAVVGGGGFLALQYGPDLLFQVERNQTSYRELSLEQSGEGSVSVNFVVNQPLLIRIPMGFIYMAVMPVPMWYGFSGNSALHFFRSVNTISFYLIFAMLLSSVVLYLRNISLRRPPLTFLLAVTLIYLSAIASTSLEVRHVGAFMPGMLVFVSLLDPGNPAHRKALRMALGLILFVVIALHLFWMMARVL